MDLAKSEESKEGGGGADEYQDCLCLTDGSEAPLEALLSLTGILRTNTSEEVEGIESLLEEKLALALGRGPELILAGASGRANKRGVTKFCGHFRLLILGHS